MTKSKMGFRKERDFPVIAFVAVGLMFGLSMLWLMIRMCEHGVSTVNTTNAAYEIQSRNDTQMATQVAQEEFKVPAIQKRTERSINLNETMIKAASFCQAGVFFRLCDRGSSRHYWRCYKKSILPIPRCYYHAPDSVRDLEFDAMQGSPPYFRPFHGFGRLRMIIIKNWKEELSLSRLIEALPGIQELRFDNTNISGYGLVHANSPLETLLGFKVDRAYSPFNTMRLSKLKTLGLEIVDHLVSPRLLTNISLETLLMDIKTTGSISWNLYDLVESDLEHLRVRFLNAVPFTDTLPYYNLKSLIMIRNVSGVVLGNTELSYRMFSHNRGYENMEMVRFESVGFDITMWKVVFPALTQFSIHKFPENVRFPSFGMMPEKLAVLDLYKTQVSNVRFSTFKYSMESVRNLTMVECSIRLFNLEVLKLFPQLTHLDLRGNLISTFEQQPIKAPNLQVIDLSGNLLLFFPHMLMDISSLNQLNLQENEIPTLIATSSIQDDVKARQLRKINFERNPIECSCQVYLFMMFMPLHTKFQGTCKGLNQTVTELSKLSGNECSVFDLPKRVPREAPLQHLMNVESDKSLFDFADPRLNLTAERARLLALAKNMPAEGEANVMRPSLGVGFEKFKYLYPGVESYYIHLYVKWPELKLPSLDSIDYDAMQVVCNDSDHVVQAICADYMPMLMFAKEQMKELRSKVLSQFDILLNSFVVPSSFMEPTEVSLPTGEALIREKRSATERNVFDFRTSTMNPPEGSTTQDPHKLLNSGDWEARSREMFYLSIFIPPAGASMTAHHLKRRTEAIRTALTSVIGRQNLLRDSHVNLRQDLTKAFTVVNDMFTNSSRNIQSLFELINETNVEMHAIVRSVQTSFNVFQQKVKAIRILSAISSRYLSLWNSNVEQYKRLLKEIDRLIDAVHELQHGKLSPYLITPTNMLDAIQKSKKGLQEWKRDYVLLFPSLAHYYSYSDLMFFPGKHGIVIQLKWPIQPRNSPKYDLYHTQSLYVPVETSSAFVQKNSNHDFTRVRLPYPFLAVSKDAHFIELEHEDLTKCTMIGDSYYCSQYYLQLDQTQLTCLTALFLNASAEVVLQHCEVDYYFEPFVPKAEIISLGHKILISGLKQPWRYQCLNDHVPRDLLGSPFGIIDSSQLCQCSIASSNGYIARRLTECDNDKQPKIALSYVPNSLIRASFPNLTNEMEQSFFVTESPMGMPT